MKQIYHTLIEIKSLCGKVKLSESQDFIVIDFNEYLSLYIDDMSIVLNNGLTHWHPDNDEDIIQNVREIANGDIVFIERRGFFTRPRKYGRIYDKAIKILDKKDFEKKKDNYLAKSHLRIYTGNEIFKHSKK